MRNRNGKNLAGSMVVSRRGGIGNGPLRIIGNGAVDSILSLSPVYLEGQSPIEYDVQWRRDGDNIPGAISATYTVTSADSGATIDAIVILPDGSQATSVNSIAIPVSGTAPVVLGVPSQGVYGAVYSWTVGRAGGVAPYTWSATNLPPGASINPLTGEVTATALSRAGTYTTRVTVTDDNGQSGHSDLTFRVLALAPAAIPSNAITVVAVDGRPDTLRIALAAGAFSVDDGGANLGIPRLQVLFGTDFTAPVPFGVVDTETGTVVDAPTADTDYYVDVPANTNGGVEHYGQRVSVNVWWRNALSDLDHSVFNITTVTVDLTPILSNPIDVVTSNTTATVGATSSGQVGNLWAASSASPLVDGAAVKAAAGAVSGAVSAAGNKTLSVTGLSAATAYAPYYFAHEIALGVFSTVVVGDGFTTLATPVAVPVFSTEPTILPATAKVKDVLMVSGGAADAPIASMTFQDNAIDKSANLIPIGQDAYLYASTTPAAVTVQATSTNQIGSTTKPDAAASSTVAARSYGEVKWGVNVSFPGKNTSAAPGTWVVSANHAKSAKGFSRPNASDLDANGYPRSGATLSTAHSATILDMPTSFAGAPYTGSFHILWIGDAACSMTLDGNPVTQISTVSMRDPAGPTTAAPRSYRHAVVTINAASGGHPLKIVVPGSVSTDPNAADDAGYIRDIHIVQDSDWATYQNGQMCSNTFLAGVGWARNAIRWMGPIGPNAIGVKTYPTGVTPPLGNEVFDRNATLALPVGYWTYNRKNGLVNSSNRNYEWSVPIEFIVKAMNEVYAYQDAQIALGNLPAGFGYPAPHINIPLQMTDAEILTWMTHVRDNLNTAKCPLSEVFIEAGNEIWNGSFDCYKISVFYGAEKYNIPGLTDTQKANYWASFRASQIYEMAAQPFASGEVPKMLMLEWSSSGTYYDNLVSPIVQNPVGQEVGDSWINNDTATPIQDLTRGMITSVYVGGLLGDTRPEARLAGALISEWAFGTSPGASKKAAFALNKLFSFGTVPGRTYKITPSGVQVGDGSSFAATTANIVLDANTSIDLTQYWLNGGSGNGTGQGGTDRFDLMRVVGAASIFDAYKAKTGPYSSLKTTHDAWFAAANQLVRIVGGTAIQCRLAPTANWVTVGTFSSPTTMTVSDLIRNFFFAVSAKRQSVTDATTGVSTNVWFPVCAGTARGATEVRLPRAKWQKDAHNSAIPAFPHQWEITAYEGGMGVTSPVTPYFTSVYNEYLYGSDRLADTMWENAVVPRLVANDVTRFNMYKYNGTGLGVFWGIYEPVRDPGGNRLSHFREAALAYPLAVVTPLPTTLTMEDFTRDFVVFDTGAAFNLTSAGVARSGTADPGEVVQLRVVTAAGTEVVTWGDAATTDGAGNWTGMAFAPLGSAALRIEARLKRNMAITASTANRFYAGHVVDVWGQSELQRSVLTGFTGASAPAIADPAALQVSYSDATGASYGTALTHIFIDGSSTNRAGRLGALANMLAAERPGERFHLVMHTLSQTGLRAALDESNTPRQWANEVAIRDFALADGQHPGLAIQSWYNADSAAFDANFGDIWLTAISGLNPNGTAHTRGTPPAAGGGFDLDFYFSDWYNYAETKWAMAGPHRFELSGFDANIQANRSGLNAVFTNPIMSARAVRVLEPLNYQNDPSDPSHPDTADPDGMSRFMVLIGYGILQGLGDPYVTPELDQWSYNAGTSTLTIGSSAGPITTTRAVRGGTLPSGRPSVDQVFRNGALVAAADVSIVSGTIRVANVVTGNNIAVGLGGIGTGGLGVEDLTALSDETWQDWPIVAGGLAYAGMEGLPVRGLAVCPDGIIPAATLPTDPNGNPNLIAASRFANFVVGTDAGATGLSDNGWKMTSAGWVFDGAGAATILAGGNNNATGELWRTLGDGSGIDLPTILAGAPAEMSFVISSPDGGAGTVNVTVSMQNGGAGITLWPIAPAVQPAFTVGAGPTLVTLPLGVIPATRNKLRVVIQRQVSGTAGTLRIERLTIKAI